MHPGVNLLPGANMYPGANCAHEHGLSDTGHLVRPHFVVIFFYF